MKTFLIFIFSFIILLTAHAQKKSVVNVSKKTLVVLASEGALLESDTTADSEDLIWLKPGDTLSYVREFPSWYSVKITLGGEVSMKGFIAKNEVYKCSEAKLTNGLLNLSFTKAINEEDTLKKVKVLLELISQEKFLQQKHTSPLTYIVSPTIQKKNGTFTLPLLQGSVTYKDSINLTEGIGHVYDYDYEGEIPALNAYIVSTVCHECEEITYHLLDKSSGVNLGLEVEHLPIYSFENKRLMSMGNQFVDSEDNELAAQIHSHVEFSLYLNNQWEESVLYKSFPMWQLVDDISEFWGNDGAYYFACQPSFLSFKEGDKGHIQYARLVILNPN